ncbi:MAG: hypothetical protein ACLGIN_08740 [Candidatus Sericytochromatia bacterium]
MTDASALDRPSSPLDQLALEVQTAYDEAIAAGWSPETREALWRSALEAVLAYAAKSPTDPRAGKLYRLVVDMAPDAPTTGWPESARRAIRLAATRTLMAPTKPHHQPRAQALLRQLDLQDNPLLQARERVLAGLAQRQQALRQAMAPGGEGPRLPVAQLQAMQDRLGRVAGALRAMPLDRGAGEERLLGLLAELSRWVESGLIFEATIEGPLYAALQQVRDPEDELSLLEPAMTALLEAEAQTTPGLQRGRLAIKDLLYGLPLARYGPEAQTAMAQHLADLAHVARHLHEIPAASLNSLLFRLRVRLGDPLNEAAEALIDEGLALLERLDARREDALAALEAIAGEEVVSPERQALQQRLWELDQLLEALESLRTEGVGRAQVPGVLQLLRRLETLADHPGSAPETFSQVVRQLAEQLENPTLISHRGWQAARTVLLQIGEQRRVLEETLRGLPLDRKLDGAARDAAQIHLRRAIAALDRARLVLGSLPIERLAGSREEEALQALAAFTREARLLAAGRAPAAMQRALEDVMQICRAAHESIVR